VATLIAATYAFKDGIPFCLDRRLQSSAIVLQAVELLLDVRENVLHGIFLDRGGLFALSNNLQVGAELLTRVHVIHSIAKISLEG
jgi:hypothetical protein